MTVYELSQVFGQWRDATAPTYVDRANLDSRLSYLLRSSSLIVLHGESNQGKTTLRRKHLGTDEMLNVNCTTGTTATGIKRELLRQIGARILGATSTHNERSGDLQANVTGRMGVPLLANAELNGQINGGVSQGNTHNFTHIGDPDDINYLISELNKDGRRIVIDDFHFIADAEQRQLAFDLKALGDNGINAMIIGVWPEHSRLTMFNSQLRAAELSIEWKDEELMRVVELGEQALNIEISAAIKSDVVADAAGNVGLLQVIASRLCFEAKVEGTQASKLKITDPLLLQRARQSICDGQLRGRFSNALRDIADGKHQSEVRMYELILRAVLGMQDAQLLRGVRPNTIARSVQTLRDNPTAGANQGHVTQTLEKINELQAERHISPPIFFYDSSSRELRLVDRTLLFYRKYRTVPYPWEDIEQN